MIGAHSAEQTPPARASPQPSAPLLQPTPQATADPAVRGPAPGPSEAIKHNATAQVREEDLLLLAADLDGLNVSDALPAYGDPKDPLLPVGELARLLDLNLMVSPADGQIVGRIGQAERPVTIDLANDVFRMAGLALPIGPSDIAVTNVDIYLKASALARILPIQFTADGESLTLHMKALEKLPIQARMDRLTLLRGLAPDTQTVEQSLRVPSPYTLFSMPSVDIEGAEGASLVQPRNPRSYDVRLAGDVLYTGFEGYIGSDQNGKVASARATFERHDVNGGLLGPINATSVAVGDTFNPSLAVGPRSYAGRGFGFSTAPLEQTSVFNHIDLRGELPVGYDVQLYVNDILRGGQRTPIDGRYQFLNVPLVRGVNVIRIVLNGPRGERNEETKIVNVSGGQLSPGQFVFEMGGVQQDTNLLRWGQQDVTDINSPLVVPGAGKLRVVADMSYGLSTDATLVGGAAVFPTIPAGKADNNGVLYNPNLTQERGLVTAGLRTSIAGASVQLDTALDTTHSSAFALGFAANPFGIATVGRQVFYHGAFIDETVATGSGEKPIASHSELEMDLGVRPFAGYQLPLSLRGTADVFTDRSSLETAGFRTSATINNVLLSGGLDMTASTFAGLPTVFGANGNLTASTFYDFKWALRASLDYQITPKPVLNALTFTADRDLNDKMAVRLGIGRDLTTGDGDTTFQVGQIFHVPFGDLSILGSYAVPSDSWQVGLTFNIGLVFDPITKRYVLTRPGVASGGTVALQAFLDTNANGVFDDGDKPVPQVTIEGGERRVTTDANGHALVTGVGAGATGKVVVGLDGIEDPYVVSPPKTVSFNPRPGKVVVAPYPLQTSSELFLHVMLRQSDGKMVGLSAVRVRLVKTGSKPMEASTEFDGTAGFEMLPPGTYVLELDPDQAARLHMMLVKPVQVVVPPQGGSLPDITTEVSFDRAAAAADVAARP